MIPIYIKLVLYVVILYYPNMSVVGGERVGGVVVQCSKEERAPGNFDTA